MHQKLFAQTFYPQKTIYTILQKDFYAKPLAHKKLFYTHLCFRRTCFTQRSENIQTFHEILTHRAVLYMKVMKVTLYIFFYAPVHLHTKRFYTDVFAQVHLPASAFAHRCFYTKNVKQKLLQVLLHTGAFTHASASTNKIVLSDPRHGISRHIF